MKHLALIYMILLSFGASFLPYTEASEPVVIPDEAIRLRILANSDESSDQALKQHVRDEVNEAVTEWVEELTTIEAARHLIQERLPLIEEIVNQVLIAEGEDQSYSVSFGQVAFPTKMYGQYIYPAGHYEAILITLGEGNGANWWCVLFPPLCFLDFSNGEAVSQADETENSEEEQVEVKFFIVEWIASLFQKTQS